MKLLIIDNYDSFVYNLIQLVEQAGVSDYMVRKNDQILSLPAASFDKVLISPGPGIAAEAGQLIGFIKTHYRTKPMLGICLGHEAIAEVFGASIHQLPEPLHGIQNMATICRQHYLFENCPESFKVGHYHSWVVDEASLPPSLQVLMRDEPGSIMAISHKRFDAVGLMFHPESVMTDNGYKIISNWIRK